MRRMRGIAHEYVPVHGPALVPDSWEPPPDRLVGHERMTGERVGEHVLAYGLGAIRIHAIEARAKKSRLVHFDHERAHVRRMAVMVCIEVAHVCRDECVRQGFEPHGSPEPGVTAGKMRYGRAELGFVMPSDQRINAICADDQIRMSDGPDVIDRMLVARGYAH